MEHERFLFALVNPIFALLFAMGFAFMRHRWPQYRYLASLSLAFLCLGYAFVLHDFRILTGPGDVNVWSNLLFVAAVLLACASALQRADLPAPLWPLVVVAVTGFLPFLWYLYVQPSLTARIFILGAVFAVVTAITAIRLLRRPSQTTADKLFVVGIFLAFVVSIIRPILLLMGTLDVASAGGFPQSDYWASIRAFTPVLSFGVAVLFLTAITVDIIAHLRGQADRDFLTNLLNRRGFEAAAGEVLKRDLNDTRQPALMVADIDNFKKVNDTYGHKAGDAVIAGVAKVLAQQGRGYLAARIGGEEFALYYRDMSRAELQDIANGLRDALTSVGFSGLPDTYRVTLSMGIHVSYHRESLIDMLGRADQALYRAKHEGKDKAVITPVQLHVASRSALGA
ncbi:diguanylate cyclase (GGDEF) domain-containing protein [Devosia crocina]|uniref:diguanylate cyclase n=1 Tax=Devosia crocina TaxID=429728 RepID=A0A1I7NDK1_9HYPH|nr:GGDEF domain-containing protein [Devosia crocina]SFV32626.1 diguanylate cyclase (GGDEF) domain-containing protein [Devosia crocina]